MSFLSYSNFTPASGTVVSAVTFTISITWHSSVSGVGEGTTAIGYRKNGGAWQYNTKSHSPIPSSYTHTTEVSLAAGDRVDFRSFAYGTAYGIFDGVDTETRYITTAVDTTAPTITDLYPQDTATPSPGVWGIHITASATDAWGVTSLKVYIDSGLAFSSSGTNISEYTQLNKGSHTIYAVAEDAAGNSTTSATNTFDVLNVAPRAPLALYIGGLAPSAVRVDAAARVTWVDGGDYNREDTLTWSFEVSYNGGGYGGPAGLTSAEYEWTPTTTGTATVRVRAYDGTDYGPYLTSDTITITTGTAPNTPTLTDPGGGTYAEGSTQSIAWTPADPVDPDGDPVTYELEFSALGDFTDAILLDEDLADSPYAWTPAASLVASDTATCKIRLRARDNYEMVSSWSTSTAFTVLHNAVPTIIIVSPAAGATITTRTPELIVAVDDADVGDKLHVEVQLAESADYSIGVINPDSSVTQTGWESAPSPYGAGDYIAFPALGCDPGDRARFTPTTNLRYDLYYYRARVTDGNWTSDWAESTFRVAPAPGALQVTIDTTDYYVEGLQIIETSGGEPSSMSWAIPSDVWAGEAKGVSVSVAINFEGTARTWTGTLEDVKSSGAYIQCTALMDDAYLSRKLATGDVVSKDLGQALKDLVTSYGSPLTGAAIDTTTGVSMAITGGHKQLREHFADALRALPDYMLWVDSTGDVHFVDTADLAVPTILLREA